MKPLLDDQERNWKNLFHYKFQYDGFVSPNCAILTENLKNWVPSPFGSDVYPHNGTLQRDNKTFGFSATGRFFSAKDGETALDQVYDLANGGALINPGWVSDNPGDEVYPLGSMAQHFRNNGDSFETVSTPCNLGWRWDPTPGTDRVIYYCHSFWHDPAGGMYQFDYNPVNNRFECSFGAYTAGRRDSLKYDRFADGGDVHDLYHFSLTPDWVAMSGSLVTGSGKPNAQKAHIYILDRSTDPWGKARQLYERDGTPSHFHRASTTNSASKFVAEFSPDGNYMAVSCRGGGYLPTYPEAPAYPYVIDMWDTSDADPNNWAIVWQLSDTVYAHSTNYFWRIGWSPDSRWLYFTCSYTDLGGMNEGALHIFDRDNSWAEIPTVTSPQANDYCYAKNEPKWDETSTYMLCGSYDIGTNNSSPRLYVVNPTLGGAWSYINLPAYWAGNTGNRGNGENTFIPTSAKKRF